MSSQYCKRWSVEYDPWNVALEKVKSDLEVALITDALEVAKGTRAVAAKMLHLNRTTLIEKMRKYNLLVPYPGAKYELMQGSKTATKRRVTA